MKVLFLDIDGVLNGDHTKEKFIFAGEEQAGIDQRLLNKYLDWLEDKDVVVVLSSSWRLFDNSMEHLNHLGIDWIDITDRWGTRGEEINLWLKDNPSVTHFAILDDTNDMKPLHKNLVQTSYIHGLRDKDLRKLNKLLDYE